MQIYNLWFLNATNSRIKKKVKFSVVGRSLKVRLEFILSEVERHSIFFCEKQKRAQSLTHIATLKNKFLNYKGLLFSI